MARLRITLPDRFVFSTEIPVRVGDINHGGHLGHESLLVIMEEARERFLESIGYSEFIADGVGFIMADIGVMYLRQGHYGQILKVEMAVTDFTTRGFDIVYRITDAAAGLELARAKTGHLFYNYQLQKTIPVPQDFRERFPD